MPSDALDTGLVDIRDRSQHVLSDSSDIAHLSRCSERLESRCAELLVLQQSAVSVLADSLVAEQSSHSSLSRLLRCDSSSDTGCNSRINHPSKFESVPQFVHQSCTNLAHEQVGDRSRLVGDSSQSCNNCGALGTAACGRTFMGQI